MATNLTRLNVALTLSTGSFSKGLGVATGLVNSFGSRISSIITGPIGALSAAFSSAALVAGIKSAADRIDDLAKSADKLGITTQSLAGLRLAADESGASAEQLQTSMTKLTVKVQEAAQGNKEAQKTFQELNIPLAELVAMRPDAQFARISDAMNGLGNSAEKTRLSIDLFGKSGNDMSATLALGSAGLEQAKKDAEAMGLALNRVDSAKVEEANDAFGRIGKVIEGAFNTLTVKLAPFVTAFATAFTDASKATGGFSEFFDKVMSAAIATVGFFADRWQDVRNLWARLQVVGAVLGQVMVDIAEAGVRAAQWIGEKFMQAWELVSATASVMWNALKVGWSAMKIPVADFVQFVGTQLASLIDVASKAAYQFSASVGASMQSASMEIQASVGAMGASARVQLDKDVASISAASTRVATATSALFSSVETTGSQTLRDMSAEFAAAAQEQLNVVNKIQAEAPASDRINEVAAQIQAEANARAKGRADQIDALKAHTEAKTAVNVEGELNWQKAYQDKLTEEQKARAANAQYALSGASSMFSNLSKLQNSHSKAAQAAGKIAAKGKIVTDTASAAMGAYSAMAAIPVVGPALGAAAAAAAVIAGGIQLGNVDKGGIGASSNGPVDTSTTNIGGIAGPASPSQSLTLIGDSFSAESLEKIFADAKERGISISGVRRA